MVAKTNSPELIGIIVDVSNSMRLNWKKRDGKDEPRIETVRDALNKEINRIKLMRSEAGSDKKAINLFCLGVGFKRKMLWRGQEMGYGTEIELDTPPIEQEQTDVVCDILALIDILPTKAEIDELDSNINNRWNQYAKNLLSKIVIEDDVSSNLLSFIYQSLRVTALQRLRSSWSNRLLGVLVTNKALLRNQRIQRYANSLRNKIEKREREIEDVSQRESSRYLENIHTEAKNIFTKNKDRYRQYIETTLSDFANEQTAISLKLLTLGHPVNRVFDTFKEDEVLVLAEKIYAFLDQDVKEKIRRSWLLNKGVLKFTEKKLGARIDIAKIERLTEASIKKLAWETHLRSFAHNVVNDLFKNTFEEKAKLRFSDWVGLAASREITRPIAEISNLLPDVFDNEIYSESFMFGSTPIYQAINLASLRFLDKTSDTYRKTLIIISDGEFKSNTPQYEADLLKQAGVTILCCYVSNSNVMKKLPTKVKPDWLQGAKMMFEISSQLNTNDEFANSLKKEGFVLEEGMKLLFQINYSDRLERILNAVLGSNQKSEF